MTFDQYIEWYFEVSPKVALRLAVCNNVPWKDIIQWNKKIREELKASFRS